MSPGTFRLVGKPSRNAQLCPERSTHGGIKAKMHVRPSKFDLEYVYQNFTRKPSKDENAKKEGVTVLPSGLQYKVLLKGTGKVHPKEDEGAKRTDDNLVLDAFKISSETHAELFKIGMSMSSMYDVSARPVSRPALDSP